MKDSSVVLGTVLLSELRNLGVTIPAVFWTITPDELDRSEIDRLNATVLVKPISPRELWEYIRERLNRR